MARHSVSGSHRSGSLTNAAFALRRFLLCLQRLQAHDRKILDQPLFDLLQTVVVGIELLTGLLQESPVADRLQRRRGCGRR